MKKNVILRLILGATAGVFISLLITIIISYTMGDGKFYPVVPELVNDMGNEINAVTLQTLLSLLYGAVWGLASLIWENEKWSLLKQTIANFTLTTSATIIVAFTLRWMIRSVVGVLGYLFIFVAVYFLIWISIYLVNKKKVKEINKKLSKS